MGTAITLRDATDADRPFLYAVYAATRQEELAAVDWDEGQKAAFLSMQFAAQDRHYQEVYPRAAYQVILSGGRPVGRWYVDRSAAEIRIIDIAVLPEDRGAGAGTALVRELLAEAAAAGLPVTIHVERFNRALGWYERLGFRQVEDRGVYLFMEWRAAD